AFSSYTRSTKGRGMFSSVVYSLIASCSVGIVASQCGPSDHPNCVNWVRNGFCNNAAYTTAHKQQYCPKSCPNIGCGATPTVAPNPTGSQCGRDTNVNCGNWARLNGICTTFTAAQRQQYCAATCCGVATTTKAPDVENRNCPKWAANPANAFCASGTNTRQDKLASCSVTCSFEINPTADCAIYTAANNVLTRQTTVQRAANINPLVAGPTVSRVYVGNTCTLALY
ncbi:hypothetical protein PENTCL1PPCAC_13372, partial [Pristionchus entomophagus]